VAKPPDISALVHSRIRDGSAYAGGRYFREEPASPEVLTDTQHLPVVNQ